MQQRQTDPDDRGKLEDFLRQATIVVDTNVLLELYRLSVPARDEALAVLESIGARLWVPHQVTEEFRRNVDVARGELAAAYKKARGLMVKASNDAKEAFGASRRWKESRGDVSGLLDETLERFCAALDVLVADDAAIVPTDDDPVLLRVDTLLNAAAAKEPDPLVVRQRVEEFATWRAPNQIPPGWRDVAAKHTPLLRAGDYLLWSELLDHAQRTPTPFLLVTNDQKDDWFTKDGEPLPALASEFGRRSAHPYGQMNFNDFLALARTALGAAVAETTLEEVVEERRTMAAAAAFEDALRTSGRGAIFADLRGESSLDEAPWRRTLLKGVMDQLNERERLVLVLYYYESMDIAEIARVLGVTESRAAQIHAQAMLRLRTKMTEVGDIDI